jgi:hypothetical protein
VFSITRAGDITAAGPPQWNDSVPQFRRTPANPMIRMVVSSNAEEATRYFTDSLSVSDYYAESQKCQGVRHGLGAVLFGLTTAGPSDDVKRSPRHDKGTKKHDA